MLSKKVALLLILFIIGYSLLALIHFVQAQIFVPQIGIPGEKIGSKSVEVGQEIKVTGTTFAEYIKAIYNWSVRAIAILAVIMIMVGGLRWIMSAGNTQAISKAKNQMIQAVIGLLLIVGANLFLSAINPSLINLKSLDIAPIKREELSLVAQELYNFLWSKVVFTQNDYQPNVNLNPGAHKCGVITTSARDDRVVMGTQCEDGKFCFVSTRGDYIVKQNDLDFLTTESQKVDKVRSLLNGFLKGECLLDQFEDLRGVVFKMFDTQVSDQEITQKRNYRTVRKDGQNNVWPCGTLKETAAGTACSTDGNSSHNCLYMSFQGYNGSKSYDTYSGGYCAPFVGSRSACPLNMRRVRCADGGSDCRGMNCSDSTPVENETKRICCTANGSTYQLYPSP